MFVKTYLWMKGCAKDNDVFSSPIYLTYKGKRSYPTVLGGLVSIILFVLMFLYSIYLFHIVITRGETNQLTNMVVQDLYKSTRIHEIGKRNFGFAVAYRGPNVNLLLDKSYFNLRIIQNRWYRGSNGSVTKVQQDLGVKYCGDTFPYEDKDQIQNLGIQNFFCPASYNYTLSSNQYSQQFESIEIVLEKCTGAL